MTLHRPTLSRATLMASLLCLTLSSDALAQQVDRQVKEELSPLVAKLTEATEPAARQVALMTWGLWIERKQLKELEAFKTSDDPGTRLGAGLALYISGQKKSDAFVIEQLAEDASLLMTLKQRVALLEDKKEVKLLEALTKKATPETTQQVARYLAEQDGALHQLEWDWALEKKPSLQREMSLQALTAAARKDSLAHVSKLLKHKDAAVQLAGVELARRIGAQHPSELALVAKELNQALASKDDAVKLAATRALLALNDRSAADAALQIAATTEDEALRRELVAATFDGLSRGLKPSIKYVTPLIEKSTAEPDKVLIYKIAAATGDAGIKDTLLKFYTSNTFEERLLAAQALPYTSDAGVVGLLERSLFEGDRRMRLYAAQGLALVGVAASLEPLQKALAKEKDRAIKFAVIDAIGASPGENALRILRFQITSNDVDLKRRVILAVRRQNKPDGLKILDQLLRDRSSDVRWDAFVASLALDATKSQPLIKASLREPPASFAQDMEALPLKTQLMVMEVGARSELSSVRPLMVGYMLKHRARFGDMLRELLLDPSYNKGSRRSILDQLSGHPERKDLVAIERLASGEKDLDIRMQAARTLAIHANPSMEATFRGMLNSPEPQLRALAAYGLATAGK